MKTVVVGDIHGKVEIVEKILNLQMPTIFIGDFMDAFDRSSEDQFLALSMALVAADERGDVTILWGNHEMSYQDSDSRCSGYKYRTQIYYNLLRNAMVRTAKDYVRAEGFLLSHAGVSQDYLTTNEISLDDYLEQGDFSQVGIARGGYHAVGGLYWCDWNREFEPIYEVPQIVGHTAGEGIREKGGSYCIDCLDKTVKEVVAIEDGTLAVWDLEDL